MFGASKKGEKTIALEDHSNSLDSSDSASEILNRLETRIITALEDKLTEIEDTVKEELKDQLDKIHQIENNLLTIADSITNLSKKIDYITENKLDCIEGSIAYIHQFTKNINEKVNDYSAAYSSRADSDRDTIRMLIDVIGKNNQRLDKESAQIKIAALVQQSLIICT